MANATTCRSYPYPEDADPPDVANDMRRLAQAVDIDICALAAQVSSAGGTASDSVRRAGDVMTGSLNIGSPATTLVLRRSGTAVDTPTIAFQSLSGSPQFGTVMGNASGLNFNVDSVADAHSFKVGNIERLRIAAAEVSINPSLDVTGYVTIQNPSGSQLRLVDNNGGHTTFLGFYGAGTVSSSGTRTGYLGYASTTTLILRNEITNGPLSLMSDGAGPIDFSPSEVLQVRMLGSAVLIGKTASDLNSPGIELFGAGSGAEGSIRTTTGLVSIQNIYCRHVSAAAADNQWFVQCAHNTTAIGGIQQNGTTGVTFATTSDARLKNDLGPIEGAIGRLLLLQPRRFTFKSDEDRVEREGFFAQEVYDVVPQAISGTPDGDPETDPMMLDAAQLVPLLTAALIEAVARIEALEASSAPTRKRGK